MKTTFTVITFLALAASTLCACSSSGAPGSSGDPKDFIPLCSSSGLACSMDTSPPSMVGQYTGQGQTTQTTSSLWDVGDMNTFAADITEQTSSTVQGTFDMGSLHLDITDGQIRGNSLGFTMYGSDVQAQDGCNAEVQAVIVGGAATTTGGTLTGELALEFTKNISGSGCTADQLKYPGTGAVFSYTATKVQ